MITTKDVKTKERKPKKLNIITTGKVKPKEFNPKGKSAARNPNIITTSNVEKYQKIQKDALKRKEKKEKK